MNTSTISQRIKNSLQILIEMHGISDADLCREIKISQATLWRLSNGESDPRASTLNAIATYFNITVDQLLGNQPIINSTSMQIASHVPAYIPVFSMEKPKELIKMLGNFSSSNWSKWINVEPTISAECFAIEVIGDSMWPDFIEGTLIVVDPKITPKHRNYVLCCINHDNELIFRQYIEERDEKILKPVNYAYKTISLRSKDSILGVIIQSRNSFLE